MSEVSKPSRRFVLGAGLFTATGLLAACGSKGSNVSAGTSGQAGHESSGATSGFPVTVTGKPGNTTVAAKPQRVVSIGYLRDADVALALDAPLVGMVSNPTFPKGTAPWQKIGADVTLLPPNTAGVKVEKVAALKPDLILASDDYMIAKDFASVGRLAPTLGYDKGIGQDTWTDQTRRIARVLGATARAETLIRSVNAQVKSAREEHPELADKTFTISPISGADQIFTINSEDDASARFFTQLGMKLSPKVTALKASATAGRAQISPERVSTLDADIVIITYTSPAVQRQFEAGSLFKQLTAVRRGAYVALPMTTAVSVGFPSVLSIPYGLKHALPLISKAARAK
jgi:iron complex transport system substrate-binding protein